MRRITRKLLVILLAEQRDIGRDLVEQLGHHRRDAVEMAGAGGAVQPLAHAARREIVVAKPAGYISATSGAHRMSQPASSSILRVARLAARIGGEILVRAELGGVDEDRGDDVARAPPRLRDQRHVAGVERAHRRHQRHRAAVRAQRRDRLRAGSPVTNDLHATGPLR